MRLFYVEKRIKLHLREIARRTNLHEPSVTRFLNSLEADRILRSERDGNLKKYSVVPSKGTFLLFACFDVERFERLPSLRKNAINIFLESLPERPVFAVLFGSTAKETYKSDSDIDVLIVTNRRVNLDSAQKEADALTALKVSVFQITYADLLVELKMKGDQVVQSALQSGYPLVDHVGYYEVLFS